MLYYLHGYQSDPFSEKGTLLRETIQAVPITYQDGAPEDLVISKCLSRISDVIKIDQHVVLMVRLLEVFSRQPPLLPILTSHNSSSLTLRLSHRGPICIQSGGCPTKYLRK